MRVLITCILTVLLLSGCQNLVQTNAPSPQEPIPSLSEWMETLAEIRGYTPQQAEQSVAEFIRPVTETYDLYRYGLINQQIGDLLGWMRARDSFRELAKHDLTEHQHELAALLEEYSQQMINADARSARLIQALTQSDEELKSLTKSLHETRDAKSTLQQQLDALKAVEEAISHKRAEPLNIEEKGNRDEQ